MLSGSKRCGPGIKDEEATDGWAPRVIDSETGAVASSGGSSPAEEISAKGVHIRALLDKHKRPMGEQQEVTSYRELVAGHGGTAARSSAAWQF